jgi:RNA 2',3'-cyclic 3'-phosphodiesterase
VRAFLAIPPDPEWVAAAAPVVARLRAELPRASWTRPDAWHLTLKFLGEVPEDAAERFAAELGPWAAAARAGELPSAGALLLPPGRRARVLAAGFAPSAAGAALEELARRADEAAAGLGVERERRAFRPHVTFARLREPWPAESLDAFREAVGGASLPGYRVAGCVLYASRLHPAGAVHTPVRTLPFAAAVQEVGA